MKIINIPILNRGPEIETSIGIFIVLIITVMMVFSTYSAYKKMTDTFEKTTSYIESSSGPQN